ncbi:hypothetical protein PRZ48_003424 [Zasmidium cellare]|uniref:ferric-chelate reductase (NADPH) n=1 Tax=Zasmidium cellare TaxID=395010 RepID=A0ABR0EWJ6_ZASCE|nr:hypothetical protein PRZ48_003424 [Zasmidium cellare]
MDMGGMDMGGGHSGHDMSGMTMSGGVFTPSDELIARGFWYGIAGCVGLLTVIRLATTLESRQRLKRQQREPHSAPSRPIGWLSQAFATTTATVREALYPQPVHFTGRFSKYFTPLPVGKWLLLVFYWVVLLCFLWSNTILKPSDPMYAYKWEKVGFRAAWVTVSQIPFVYLLSCKFNPISLLTGISYERFNWLHRWAARTVFLTAIVHWSFFFTEWDIANIVSYEFELMPMVKYGFGAWAIIGWMVLSGFGFFRNMNYEIFVLQHIAAAAVLLWVLFVHVPTYAQYNIWMSVAFITFDWGARLIWGILRNTHLLGRVGMKLPGYAARLEPLPGDVVRLTTDEADFSWKAGQHAYITIPGLYRPFETHPFTIANAPSSKDSSQRRLTMLIQARSGFSRSLHKAALKSEGTDQQYRTFILGPWGMPPDLSHYDTIVLIACSSGASFIMPLLQDVMKRRGCVRTITLHWIIKEDNHFSWFGDELAGLAELYKKSTTSLQVNVHITRSDGSPSDVIATATAESKPGPEVETFVVDSSSEAGSSLHKAESAEKEAHPSLLHNKRRREPSLSRKYAGRPTLDSMIRPSVEQALGETAVVVCGGQSITAQSRTYVAALSDERAVHKGTGAQGIMLHTETYGW